MILNDFHIRLLIIGDVSVGKTSIINSYNNKPFHEQYITTISLDQQLKVVQKTERSISLQIFDTPGQKKYQNYPQIPSHGIIFVFDLAKKTSLDYLSFQIRNIKKKNKYECIYLLLGNKNDLIEQREIGQKEIDQFLKDNNFYTNNYREVSAKTNDGIQESIDVLVNTIYEKKKYDEEITINEKNQRSQSNCC